MWPRKQLDHQFVDAEKARSRRRKSAPIRESTVRARKKCADPDLWARKKCADTQKWPNGRGKGAPTAQNGRGKNAPVKLSNHGHKWVPGLKSSGKPILARTISPRSVRPTGGDGASRFWKRGELEDARPREGRARTPSRFPRFELNTKSGVTQRAKKRPNFRTRSRSPPRAPARARRAKSKKRQVSRLHSATFATRNG